MSEAHDTTETVDATVTASGEGGDWRSSLPEDIASHDLVKNSEDVAALAKQAIDMQAYQGQSIRLPSEHASEEDRAAARERLQQHFPELMPVDLETPEAQRQILQRMGLPSEPTGYQRPSLPENVDPADLDLSMVDTFQPIAHEVGLTQAQFEGIVGRMSEDSLKTVQERRSQHDQEMKALRTEWGFAYDTKTSAAEAVAKTARDAGVPLPEDLSQVGAPTLRWLASLGEKLAGEGSSLQKDQGEGTTVMTPAEARARLDEMLSNREHPIWDQAHPAHRRALQEKARLTELSMGAEGAKPAFAPGLVDYS